MSGFDWSKLTEWKLLEGSHEFPGPDGGTCINEAAIIAAGFPYRKVDSWRNLPSCFSPILGQWLIITNDKAAPADRQKLIPFVSKLAGTNHGRRVEEERFEFLCWMISWVRVREDGPEWLRAPVKQVCVPAGLSVDYEDSISSEMEEFRTITTEQKRRLLLIASDIERHGLANTGKKLDEFLMKAFVALTPSFSEAMRIANLLYEIGPAPSEVSAEVCEVKLQEAKQQARERVDAG